ncbi:hypothetical protein N7447_004628 [Penicillium robsamsonii]|uniref:uncharacterized protein n=1 Tax=Penicillium robsamsonii TaxID=1792511 RepID=UPI00254958EF|nr:uncharacterized protein N7447_004628 [Penicillium robsamsonii]KAJ5827865.1 hypothetical protein N7447_004628 [Penicillium robsamsonii]
MSDPAGYTVGWICALPVEYVAAQEFLDEEHDKPRFVSPNDTNDYTLGKMGEHNVVIAVLPNGEYGTASAASVATNMLNSFHNIRIGLMVGIGGGVPSETHDIRLGDVVVSAPRFGESGVFQYDFGKSIQGQKFQHTRFLNQPPTTLRTAMTGMQAQYKRKGHKLMEAINIILNTNFRLRSEYERPESSTDRLFQPSVNHESACGNASCVNDASNLVLRRERSEVEDNPAIHYGLIASANQLMKDALIRDRLAAEKDVLCFEMEAAGLMNTFPCLVIRGVCDYSDSHKNKQWQGYAAMVAAAYARDLLQRIPLNRIEAEEKISAVVSEELKGIQDRLDQAYSQQERHQDEQKIRVLTEQQQRCHQVFKTSNYEEQKDINPRRAEGTCQWALQSSEYIRWLDNNCNGLLWVSADPGCGKSVLARSIIDDYVQASCQGVAICYFFFKDNDEQNNFAAALCSVLHQLFSQQPHLLQHAIPAWEKNGEKLRQEVNELWRILIAATSADISCKTICIFDALDECRETDQRRLIDKLQAFHRGLSSLTEKTYLKFLVTSRPYDDIQDHFRVITDSFPHIHIKGEEQNDQIHEEIDLVVRIRVRELAETVPLLPELHHRIEQQLLQMEHRTYLWLHLAIDDIRTTFKHSLRPAKNSITLIPPSVDAAYEKILCRVPADEMDIVKKILEIIVAARRPLTIREMAVALGIATYPEARTTMEAGLDPTHLQRKIRKLCGLFVFTNNSKIYLIHQTAREFLIQKENLNNLHLTYWSSLSNAEDQMAGICLRYLLMEDLEDDEGQPRFNIRDLLEYSAVHWADHVRKMTLMLDQEVPNRLHPVYDMCRKRVTLWFPIFWRTVMPNQNVRSMNALSLAAFNGHEQEVLFLLAIEKHDINAADEIRGNPLIWASREGHDKIVQILLEDGADVNAQGGEYGNALQAASWGGHDKIVQTLLERGADVNAQGGYYGNALQAASWGGYDKIVHTLLERGADVNAQGGYYGNALQAASWRGHDKIVQTLLEHGADVNAQGGEYGNALQAASSGGDDKIVQTLLEHRADVNAQGGYYGNALYAASYRGDDKIVQTLLEHGADVNALGGYYGNALYAASSEGHDKIVQTLLEHGADVNAQDGEYGNALYAASSGGDDRIVQTLLEHGADVNAQGGYYGNALQAASSEGHDKIVQTLLERGADINAQGGHYGNALQEASFRGHYKIVQILLEHGADGNAQGGEYGNALQAASWGGYDKIVHTLLERGADVNAQGGYYGNALQAASWGGHDRIVQTLLEHGADVNAQGGEYGNALQAASSEGYGRIVHTLLEHGADVNAQGGEYGNALQAASWGGYDKIVHTLLERGADVNAQGGYYGNALQAASWRGHDRIVQTLLEHGADVNAQGGGYGNALQAASWGGYDKIVHTLLEHGADVNAQGGYYGNALQAASWRGHDRIVQTLLEHGADVNAQGGESGNALQAASWGGYDKIVHTLLERGADVNAQGGYYGNALQAASWGGHDRIVQTLLEHGADVNAQGGYYGNALQAASSEGYDKIVQTLLERGADVNVQGGDYGNALQAASSEGHDEIVQTLLEHGADVNAQGGEYGNALQAASWGGYDKIVHTLLERGADVNAQGGYYGNALQAASWGGHDRIVQTLLEHGADVNAQGGEYGNALQAARRGGYHHIVKFLQGHQFADQLTSQPPPSKRLKVST